MNDVAVTPRDDLNAAIAERAQHYNLSEFIQGQADCRDGVEHKAGKGESYDAGYDSEYHAQEAIAHRTRRGY